MPNLTLAKPLPAPDFQQRLLALEPVLLSIALALCKRPEDAFDLVQDSLERGLRAGPPPTSNLRGWLVAILQNRFIDLWRRRGHTGTADRLEELPAAPPVEEPAWACFDRERLRAAVDLLPSEFREVYSLHALEGRSYAEIAGELRIPKATVGTRLYRARRRLRELLEAELRWNTRAGDLALAQRRVRRAASARSA